MKEDQFIWRKKLKKCPIGEKDLKDMGVWKNKEKQFKNLYLNSERNDCILIQGAGLSYKDHIFLTLGIGAINILEAFSQFDDVQGVIGTGNAFFLSKDCNKVYSALQEKETLKRYKIDKTKRKFKYQVEGKLAPLIILNRVFTNRKEFEKTKAKKADGVSFDLGDTFFTEPVKFSGSLKSRLRSKFINTVRTVHCVHHRTLMEKELFFDSKEDVIKVIDKFEGYFMLGYTYFSETFANSIGMDANFKLDIKDNSSEIVSFTILKLVEQFYKKNKNLFK